MKLKSLILSLIYFGLNNFTFSQTTGVGTKISAILYKGDLAPSIIGFYQKPTVGLGLFFFNSVNKAFDYSVGVDYNTLAGNDSYSSDVDIRELRNFSFSATNVLLSVNGYYNFRKQQNSIVNPYIAAGLGVSFNRIKRSFSTFDYSYSGWQSWVKTGLTRDSLATMPTAFFTIPVGLGIRVSMSPKISVMLQMTNSFVFTDYLDGFSYSARSDRKDQYASFSLEIIHHFGNSGIPCPKESIVF